MQTVQIQRRDPTKRLPVEILAMIFHAWKDASRTGKERGLRAEWVRATWVCKRWREVALGTPTLWSSVLISRRGVDNVALATQLDRARGTALDIRVSSRRMSGRQVADAFGLVLAKKTSIKTLTIFFNGEQGAVIEAFVKNVAAKLVSLFLRPSGPLDKERWNFTQDDFPRLRRLFLCCITPIPRSPLLNLTHLHLDGVVESFSKKADRPWTCVHRFLAACPNLETLRSVYSFEYPLEYLDPHNDYKDLPIVTLPKLRHLSVEGLALDMSTALGTLRLPALSTFDITAYSGVEPYDCDFYVVPRNISDALPPLRRSRCLSFAVGGCTDDLVLRGSPGDTFEQEPDGQWSITLPDLEHTSADSESLGHPCCIRHNCSRFLARLPLLVPPASALVRLELHVANGLPVAHDWARFFVPMARLRALAIGCDALVRRVLGAFAAAGSDADAGLCPELEDLELCLGAGPGSAAEEVALAGFITHAVRAWARGRAVPLKTLTVLTSVDVDSEGEYAYRALDCCSDAALEACGERHALWDCGAGSTPRDTAEPTCMKLWRVIVAAVKAEGSVAEVFLETGNCSACGVDYEPLDAVEFGDDGLREGVGYY